MKSEEIEVTEGGEWRNWALEDGPPIKLGTVLLNAKDDGGVFFMLSSL
jgi:hypothetical protein